MFASYGLLVFNVLSAVGRAEYSNVPTTVVAVAGYTAEIPCSVSTPLADDEASLILWYRLDMPNPIYTLDVRNKPISGARHFPAAEMEGRAYFNVSDHPPVLVINPVYGSDEADYKCRVDLKRSRTLILFSKLDVIVPPGEPIIMDEHGQRLHDVIGPYDEGSTLIFICEVDGGDPSPDVSWWRDGVLVDDSFNATTQGFVRNDLFLEDIQREDWMAEYTCKASNTNTTSPMKASLQVDMNLSPLDVRIIFPDQPMMANQEQNVACETRGSRPRALTSWWLEEKELRPIELDQIENENITLSILRFTPSPEDDGKKLSCKSYNPILPKKALHAESFLNVQFVPILNLTLVPTISDAGAKEGSDIYFECKLRTNPGVYNFTWEFEDRLLKANKTLGIVILNHTLLLQKVRKDHQGKYRCHATNAVGTGTSEFLFLLVQFAPICKFPDPIFYGTSMEEHVNLTCDVESNPQDVQFQWYFNNSMETDDKQNWINDANASILQYTPKTSDGFGTFMCWGRNTVGLQKNPCIFKVIPAGPPEPLYDCRVTNRTSDSLSVDCKPGYNGSLTQTFHLEIYNSIDETITENVTNEDAPNFEVLGLPSSTSYVLVIYSSNAKGRSKSLALVAATMSPAKRRIARDVTSSLNPVIGAIVGVVLLFVIACIILIIIFKSRSMRQEFRKEEKTECEMEKKELEESQDANGKGPDIIPLSKDPEVFHLDGYMEDVRRTECLQKHDSPPTEFIRLKYMHTVL